MRTIAVHERYSLDATESYNTLNYKVSSLWHGCCKGGAVETTMRTEETRHDEKNFGPCSGTCDSCGDAGHLEGRHLRKYRLHVRLRLPRNLSSRILGIRGL